MISLARSNKGSAWAEHSSLRTSRAPSLSRHPKRGQIAIVKVLNDVLGYAVRQVVESLAAPLNDSCVALLLINSELIAFGQVVVVR